MCEEGAGSPRRREIFEGGARGQRGEGQSCPYLLLLVCKIVALLSLFRPGLSFDLGQIPHSLSVRFASNLCSLSDHIINARMLKHVVKENQRIVLKNTFHAHRALYIELNKIL